MTDLQRPRVSGFYVEDQNGNPLPASDEPQAEDVAQALALRNADRGARVVRVVAND